MGQQGTNSGTKGSWKGQNVEGTLRFNKFFCRSFKLMDKCL